MTHSTGDGQTAIPGAASSGAASPGTGPRFGGESCWVDLDGPVHYLDYGGPAGASVIVAVHGLEGSAVNWSALAPLLTDRYRVLAPDLAGHGFTRSAGRGVDVSSNRVLLHRFIEAVAGPPVILMGNSMGGMISLSEAAAAPGTVTGLILLDPALPFMPVRPDPSVVMMFLVNMVPGLSRRMISRRRQLSPDEVVARVLATVCADPSRVSPDVVEQHVEVARRRFAYTEADREFTLAARSVVSAAGYITGRAYRRAIDSVRCPVLILHGTLDRLIPVAAARMVARAHPDWSLVVLPGVGHVPQLEVPYDCATEIREWLSPPGRGAASAAAASAT
ncbi:MAG: alpha/beta fold hydrolase [Streptosporangiaceae bacterium]